MGTRHSWFFLSPIQHGRLTGCKIGPSGKKIILFCSAQPHFSALNVQSCTCMKPLRPWRLHTAMIYSLLIGKLSSMLHFSMPFSHYPRRKQPGGDLKQLNSPLTFRFCPKHRSSWSVYKVSAPAGLLLAPRALFPCCSAMQQGRSTAGLRGAVIKTRRLSSVVLQLPSDLLVLFTPTQL